MPFSGGYSWLDFIFIFFYKFDIFELQVPGSLPFTRMNGDLIAWYHEWLGLILTKVFTMTCFLVVTYILIFELCIWWAVSSRCCIVQFSMFRFWLSGLLFILYVYWTAASRVAAKELERIDILFGHYADKDAEGLIGLVITIFVDTLRCDFLKIL
jgi:hypothetical protein